MLGMSLRAPAPPAAESSRASDAPAGREEYNMLAASRRDRVRRDWPRPASREPLEPLEPRLVLSDTYYVWQSVEELPGYAAEYGEPDSIVGASDSGVYLWSAAAADRADADEPYIVVERQVRYLRDIPTLSDVEITGVNSHGLVLAEDLDGADSGRVFLLDLAQPDLRVYIDSMELESPPEFDAANASPLAVTDGAGLVLVTASGSGRERTLWLLHDGSVTRLWSGDGATIVDANSSNGVIGYRTPDAGPSGAVLWTPSDGVTDLAAIEILHVASLNDDGTVLGMRGDDVVLWRDGQVEATGFSSRDPIFLWPVSRDGAGRLALKSWNADDRGFGGADHLLIQPEGELTILSGAHEASFVPHFTESGILLNLGLVVESDALLPPGGWYEFADTARLVAAEPMHGASAWTDQISVRIEAANEFGYARFSAREDGSWDWEAVRNASSDMGVLRQAAYDPTSQRWLVASAADGHLEILGPDFSSTFYGKTAQITRAATPLFTRDGRAMIAGLNDDGHVVIIYEVRGAGQSSSWWDNLSENHLGVQGLATPEFQGELRAFVTPWNGLNIVGLDASGDVHAVWWTPARFGKGWTVSNLSAAAGAPKLTGPITATATPWGAMQIFGTDERGHLIGLWWAPNAGGWHTTDLTAHTNGLTLDASRLTVQMLPWAGLSIVGKTTDGEIAAYWWTPETGWASDRLADSVGDPLPFIPGPVSYEVTRTGSQHIAAVDEAGHVLHLFWHPDGQGWRIKDLTELALG
jgi:hypothetical protein